MLPSRVLSLLAVGACVPPALTLADGGSEASAVDCGASYREVVLCDGPQHYWRFEDEGGPYAFDEIAEAGTLVYPDGGVTFGVPGAVNGELAVRLGQACLAATDPTVGQFPNAFSLEAWIEPTSVDTSYQRLIHKEDVNGTVGYSTYVRSLNGITVERTVQGQQTRSIGTGDGSVTSSAFSHVVATWDGNTLRAYANGKSAANALSGADTSALSATGTVLQIGCNPQVLPQTYFDGVIDEIALYDYALTPSQVSRHYQAATAP